MDTNDRSKSKEAVFDQFWAAYPRKVGKLAAKAEWLKALRIASFEEIMAGVDRYKACKPDYADWCHPKTWLRQGRWMDEADSQPSSHNLSDSTVKTLTAVAEILGGKKAS